MDVNFEYNLRYKDCMGKYVKVKTVDSREHEGWLNCIDPMTGNLILTVFDESFENVIDTPLIMGHACTGLEVLKEDNSVKERLEYLKNKLREMFLPENLCDRKQRLRSWLEKHRLPVGEERGKLVVARKILIHPPYLKENCHGVNQVFLKNIVKLVAEMPDDYKAENPTLAVEPVNM